MPNQASAPITVPLQQVYDWIVAGGDPTAANAPAIVGARVTATLQFNSPTNLSPVAYVGDRQFQTVTDQNGFWSLMLAPNTGLSPSGTTWLITTPQNTYEISVGSAGPYQSSSILVNTPSTISPAVTGLTGPITVAGNETVTGTLTVSGATTLASTTTGALTTAAESVGGDLTIQSAFRLLMLAAVSKLVPGVTSFSVRDNADANDNLLVTNAGNVTARGSLTSTAGPITATAGDLIATAGRLVLNAAAAKIKGGATSLSLRNNADSADNVLVSDLGLVTLRNAVSIPSTAAGSVVSTSYGSVPVLIALATPNGVATTGAITIPSWVNHLEICATFVASTNPSNLQMIYNACTTYAWEDTASVNAAASMGGSSPLTSARLGVYNNNLNWPTQVNVYMNNIQTALTVRPITSVEDRQDGSGTAIFASLNTNYGTVTAAVTSLTFTPSAGNFAAGTMISIYGKP